MKLEQITAWALDEASAEERLQLEVELRADPTAQKTAEDTKAFCDFLLAELRDDSLALTEAQRERLKTAVADPAPSHTVLAPKKAEPPRAQPKWRTSIGLRLGLAACLTVGCVVAWQMHEQKVQREALAMKQPVPVEAKKFQVKLPSPALPGMPAPSDPKRRTVAENASGTLLRDQQALPGGAAPNPPQASIPALPAAPMPGTPPSVLMGSSTLTPGDVAELKRMEDRVSYGLVFDVGGKNGASVGMPHPAGTLNAGSATLQAGASGSLKLDGGVLAAATAPGGGITAGKHTLGSLILTNALQNNAATSAGRSSSVATDSSIAVVPPAAGGLVSGADAPTTIMSGWARPSVTNTGSLNAAAAASELGVTLNAGHNSHADFNGMTNSWTGMVAAASTSSPAVVGINGASVTQNAAATMTHSAAGMTRQGGGTWNTGNIQTAATGSPALAGTSIAVTSPLPVGLVVDSGTPVTINGGWAGPPSAYPMNGNTVAATFASSPATTVFGGGRLQLGGPAVQQAGQASQAVSDGEKNVELVHKGLLLAGSAVELGNYDTAISQYQDVVRVDPYNTAARRGMEEAEKKRGEYFKSAYDHQRAKMLAQVDESWEEKVPVTASVTTTMGDIAAVSPAPISNPVPDSRYFSTTSAPQSEPKASWPTQRDSRSSTESYQRILENELKDVTREPLSTFSIDVDTAAYANVRRFLNQGSIPPADAVRIEELINYFPAAEEGPAPGAKEPFGVRVEMAPCPWQPEHRLARIAIKGRELGRDRKSSNLVFLVDVSGSMDAPTKLPLVQQSLRMMTEQLGEGDRVTMVVYAGSSGLALPPTNGEDKQTILAAIDKLKAGGSTHGSAGIYLAYEQAVANFIKEGVNRVILCTDGDFNVGVNTPDELEKLITKKAKSGVFLSVLGFGSGNLKDHTMETLADKGNGNYAYIDSLSEARKVLVEQMGGTLVTIAKDVKIQVEFNPAAVRSYRLVGYENRLMAKEDFNDDTKDAGEIGAGHSVVALYEVVPANLPPGAEPRPLVDNLRYQQNAPSVPPSQLAEAAKSGEVMTVKLRYKEPESSLSKLIEVPAKDEGKTLTASTEEFKFSAAVAGFGLLLRDSAYKGTLGWETVRKLAIDGKGSDKLGYRGEFLQLIDKARGLKETRQ